MIIRLRFSFDLSCLFEVEREYVFVVSANHDSGYIVVLTTAEVIKPAHVETVFDAFQRIWDGDKNDPRIFAFRANRIRNSHPVVILLLTLLVDTPAAIRFVVFHNVAHGLLAQVEPVDIVCRPRDAKLLQHVVHSRHCGLIIVSGDQIESYAAGIDATICVFFPP